MPKSFYIIDGHAQIYRAYFAPFRDLSGPGGEPTKATFVFTQWLLNLVQLRKPDYLAMVIDESGDEIPFRKDIFKDYKANRKPPPDDFFPQEQRILRIVRDAGIPVFGKAGFEADDVIATMANTLCRQDFETFVVSRDKDLRQIVGPCVKLYDVAADKVVDAQIMRQELGYGPEKAVEIQTLMGDSIDNVPGIPGVGPKTAVDLITKYGSADAVLEHLDELKPKMRENFGLYKDRLPVARKLVTLKNDVPMEFDPQQCVFNGINVEGIRPHLQQLGFNSLLTRLDSVNKEVKSTVKAAPKYQPFQENLFGDSQAQAAPEIDTAQSTGCQYTLIDTDEKFAAFVKDLRKQKRFAFDTETTGTDPMSAQLVGMSFSWKQQTGYYVPVKGPAGCAILDCDAVLETIKPILEDEKIQKVGHNIKYDILVMRQLGIDVRGVVLDSMIAAFLIDASRMQYGIDRLAMDLLNFKKVATIDLIGKGKQQLTMDRVELNRIACYAGEDADIAWRLAEMLGKKLDEIPVLRKLNDEIETPLIDVLAEMEFNGIAVDPAILKQQSQVLGERIDELRKCIFSEANCGEFNIDSPKQLGDVLFTKLGLRSVKKTKTGQSTDIEVLEKLAAEHPVPKLVLEYRSLVKLKNTYLDNLTDYMNPRDGRIHTSFNQTGAATGRLSSSDPNLQNIPIRTDEGRRIRSAFVPGDREHNVLMTADYSQIELRVLAHFTKEPALVRAFELDEDIHRAVASEVFNVPLEQVTREQRAYAKIINFGIIYGVSAYGSARRIEGLTVPAAAELIDAYHKRFPAIRQFLEKCVAEAQTHGYVETLNGRRRPISEIHSNIISMRNMAERMAINSVVQGTAADLIKIAMVNIHNRLEKEGRPSKMLLQVHDELVFETPQDAVEKDAEIVRHEMTAAMKLNVPLKVEINWAKNWQEVK